MERLLIFVNENFIWGIPMLAVFVFVGAFFTVKLRFRQFNMRRILRETLFDKSRGKDDKHNLSPFQTLAASLATTLGTGNIVAVGAAISFGGAGAIFWMWVSALLGMATTYAENVLGMKYRERRGDGGYFGGAFLYIGKGMKSEAVAWLYAVFCILASFGMGNMAQMNAMTAALSDGLGVNAFVSAAVGAVVIALLIFGGMKRLGRVSERVIPVASIVYILGCLAVIFLNITRLPDCFYQIFSSAFTLRSAGGGILGSVMLSAMQWGVRRGVFSNEAGLGSSVIINAASTESSPQKQGSWAMLQVFIDTIIICTMTALVIIITGNSDVGEGAALLSFTGAFGSAAGVFLALAITVFTISTAVGWSVFGSACMRYLFGERTVIPYLALFALVSFAGGVLRVELVYQLSDLFNGLMALPNLAAVLCLSKEVE